MEAHETNEAGESQSSQHRRHKQIWHQADSRLFPSVVLALAGVLTATVKGSVRGGDAGHKLIALLGVAVFVIFAVISLRIFTGAIRRLVAYHSAANQAATIQLILRIIGYLIILVVTLGLLAVPVGRLLVGGAVTGIILGVAAQEALANFFASIVIMVSRPITVGQKIQIKSGPLGGEYTGVIEELGLTHIRLREKDGTVIRLPNSSILASAAIITES